jgi:hypothetical protein
MVITCVFPAEEDSRQVSHQPAAMSDTAKEPQVKKKKKQKLTLGYKPVGFLLGWAGGAVAGLTFQKTWKVLRHEDNAPDALDRDRGWGEVLIAAAVQGAIFAVVRSAVDRSGAKAIERATRSWPSNNGGRSGLSRIEHNSTRSGPSSTAWST